MSFQRKAVLRRPDGAFEKPDSGHADTISITVRACRTGGTP
jgi:hypothetical protein